jgi:hypothetical protein
MCLRQISLCLLNNYISHCLQNIVNITGAQCELVLY